LKVCVGGGVPIWRKKSGGAGKKIFGRPSPLFLALVVLVSIFVMVTTV